MKKTFRLLSMAALALMGAIMTGCSSDDNTIDTPQQPENKNNVVTLTTTIGLDDGGTTRALTATGVKTFAAGETMAIYYWKNKGNDHVKAVSAPLTAGDITNGGKSATFTFTLDNPYKDMSVSYVYPAAMAKADFNPNYDALYNNQDGTLATLASNFDFCTRSGAWSGGNLPTLTLVNQLAILAINLKNSTGASDITGDITGLTLSDGTYTYAVSRSAAAGPIYVAIRPTTSATITVTATDGTKNYTKSLTGKTYEAGNGYSVSWRMAEAAPSYDKEMNLSTTSSDVTVPEGEHWLIKGYAEDICVTIGNGATVTLNGVEFSMYDPKPCIKCSGDATIILADGTTNTLTAADSYSGGIQAGPTGKTLTIKGNTGVLTVAIDHTTDATAIGAYNGTACGDIVIEGGVINATSQNGAAIGACYGAACGNITISGGTVTAKAGGAEDNSGVGIGGHYNTACGDINITGGTVTATGFKEPGIGGDNNCGDITISGGTVKATKGELADMCIGIGNSGTCGTITIGGKVYWDGSNYQNGGDTYLTQDQIIYPTPAP